jgi:Bacterial Ig-like domain (group 3)/FG-GAP-like repeat
MKNLLHTWRTPLSQSVRESALGNDLSPNPVRCNGRDGKPSTRRRTVFGGIFFVLAVMSLMSITGCKQSSSLHDNSGRKLVRYCVFFTADSCTDWQETSDSDPAPAGPNPPYAAVAVRQDDCSLTRFILDNASAIQPAFTIPNYQDQLHQNSGLTTTPNQFKNGCTDPRTGIASQQGLAIGPFANGNRVLIGLSNSDVVLTIITSTGSIVSTQNISVIPASETSAIAFTAAAADLNGDGNSDIVVASSGFSGANSGQVSILLGNGDGTFQTPANIPVVAPITGVTIDDMNGDGKLDLVVVGLTLFNGGTGLEVLPGKGDGTFGTAIPAPDGVQGLVAVTADFNNDRKKDIATSTGQILLGKGDGTFTLQPATLPTLTPTGGNPNTQTGIAAADFNKDGNIDLAVTNAVALTVDLYFGNGDGTFTYQESYPSVFGHQNIQTTDIDGDGNADLFVGTASGGGYGTDVNAQGLFLSLLNNGTGRMAAAHAYLPAQPALQFPVVYDMADFNGDKKPDILTIGADAGNTTALLSVLKGNGDGTFAKGTNTNITIGGLVNAQAHLNALVAGDFDGDGKMDAAFAYTDQAGNNTVSVALGNGDGTFKAQSNFSLPAAVVNLVVSDINGDGQPDLAFIANPSTTGDTTGTELFVMLNQSTSGNLAFHAAQLIDTKPNLGFVAASDLNGDNKQDVIVTSSNQGTQAQGMVFVYLGKGDGTFQTAAPFIVGTFPGPVTAADLTSDGKLDLLVAATNSDLTTGTLTVLPGKGDGTFGTAITSQISEGSGSSIVVGNTVPGSQPHVILGTCCGDNLTLDLVSVGDGTFLPLAQQDSIMPIGVSAQLVKLVDVNGDNLPDLAMVSNQYAIEVFLNLSGSLVTTTPTNTAVTASAATITLGQSVTFTATVTPQSGTGVPTGTVTFLDGGTSLGTGTLNGSGVATLTTSSLAQGAHSVTANYAGDANFFSSISPVVSVQVNGGALISTTTAITGPTTGNTGASITFTATVTPASGAAKPTGTVSFLDSATSLGTGTLSAAGVATLSISTLSVGAHTITAKYGGDANFSTSTSSGLTITISAPALIPTVTTLTGPSTAVQGASVTFMVSVTPTTPKSPTGIITFLDGTTSLGTATLNSASAASFTTSSLSVGPHSITAQYPGDANFAASISLVLTITISGVTTPHFVLSASSTSVTVARNQPGVTTITATPSMSGMLRRRKPADDTDETIQFSCTGLPAGVTCAFAPPSLTLDSSAVSTQLTISEGAASAALSGNSTNMFGGIFGAGGERGLRRSVKALFLPALGCEFMLFAGLWRRKKPANVCGGRIAYAGAFLAIVATFAAGCSGRAGSMQPTSTTITINAAVGNQVVPLPLNVIIQN